MEKILLSSVLGVLFSIQQIHGAPLELSGVWKANGALVPSFRIETVVQRVYSEKDKLKLRELRSAGHTCTAVTSATFRCSKSLFESWEPSENHRKNLTEKSAPQSFEVVSSGGEPRLISEGDVALQWQLPVVIYNSFGKTNEVIYWELSDTDKLQFEIGGMVYWPHFTENHRIYFRDSVTESKENRHTQFYYDVVFTRR